jgi:VanZ family protein
MQNLTNTRWKTTFGVSALVIWLGILFATLFPFQFHPENDVRWLAGGGIGFYPFAIVVSDGPVMPEASGDDSFCSIEVLLKPNLFDLSATFLTFSRKGHPGQFRLHQYHDGLVIWREFPQGENRYRLVKRDVDRFFRSDQTVLLTLTSSPRGTSIYSNGQLIQKFPAFPLSRQTMGGELDLGTDPVHVDPWPGELHGLALYNRELSPAEVAANYQAWSTSGFANCQVQNSQTALFTFQEGHGSSIRNLCAGGAGLSIPPYFLLPFKTFLTVPWKEFSPTWDYVNDLLRNIIGFVPLGFALCGYLSLAGKARHAVLITILCGFLTSLSVEISQAYIPQRESGLTDVITNSTGSAIGAYLLRWRLMQNLFGRG